METPAQRRLRTITWHLLPLETNSGGTDILRPRCLSSEWLGSSPPVVIGGMVLDVQARPYGATRPGTTTPGEIKYVNGGVGRNVAECMAKLGVKPFMISVVGHDMAGKILLEHWVSCELSTQGIQKLQNGSTPIVLNVFDASGELAAGVASVGTVEKHLSPDWIEHFRQDISSAPIVMVDANLHPRSLETACQIAAENKVPVWFEPVSVEKSKRVASVVKYITFASPNEEELIAMANSVSYGSKQFSFANMENHEGKESIMYKINLLKPAICLLLDKGIKVIVLTLGSDGVLVCSKDQLILRGNPHHTKYDLLGKAERHLYDSVNNCHPYEFNIPLQLAKHHSCSWALHFPALSASVVSLTGAGDCLVGGMLASLCSGLDFIQSVAVAISTAKAAVESEVNVPSQISISKVADEAREIFRSITLFDLFQCA